MDCIVTAGGSVPQDDPLYPFTKGGPKSLLEIHGVTMLEYVIRALDAAKTVDHIYVVGLNADDVDAMPLPPAITILPECGGLITNLATALDRLLEDNPRAATALLCSADIPLLTADVIDAYVEDCRPFDYIAYYNVVTRETMESRFPGSGRTFVPLRDQAVAGGDMMLVQTRILETNDEFWEAVFNARKHAWRLARLVGLRTVLKLVFRRLTLGEIETLASRLVDAPVRVVESPYPELAMDVDKPQQVELLSRILQGQFHGPRSDQGFY